MCGAKDRTSPFHDSEGSVLRVRRKHRQDRIFRTILRGGSNRTQLRAMQKAKEGHYTLHQPPLCKRQHRLTTERLNNRVEGERGTHIPSPVSHMRTTTVDGNRAAESDAEGKRREPILSPASVMQTAEGGGNKAAEITLNAKEGHRFLHQCQLYKQRPS